MIKKAYSQKTRSAWLRRRLWPFQAAVIHPTGHWRISAGIYDTFGEGRTFEEAVDDAINNEKRRGRGCCRVSVGVVTTIPEAKSRQMLRAAEAMIRALTHDGCHRVCASSK